MSATRLSLRVTGLLGMVCLAVLLAAQDSAQDAKGDPSPPPKQDEQKPPRPQRVRVSQGVAEKLLVKKVPPEYPKEAREQHIQGVVLLQAEIGTDGAIHDLRLVSGHPLLAQAAIEAVRQWKYKPFLLNREPVEVETQIQINFTLNPR